MNATTAAMRPSLAGDVGQGRGPGIVVAAVAVVGVALLTVGILWALSIGSEQISWSSVVHSWFSADSPADQIVRTIRLPRVLLAALVGANLAVSGAVMQAITANPIASPDIMGVNSGAAMVVVAAITIVPTMAGAPSILLAFGGAAAAGITVMVLAGMGTGKVSPVRLALAGVTASTLLVSLTQVLVIFHENDTQSVLFWLVGGVNFAQWHDIGTVLPWTAAGLLVALALAKSLNILALGEDMARGLGQHVERTRAFGAAVVIVLCGASVAVAGPIAFIGLIAPHITRKLVGSNYLRVLPVSMLVGAVLTVYADIGSRYVNPPFEVPTGVVTALVGAPIFIYLARRQKVTR
ncbi:putative siderophore transport system permease protein YfiZ [Streptomyces sp. MBT84]|uniref:FecCD family ABC transporter permease n=1 Tax=Streptomyces sp. MBT84 TaxID=1488414 RepID=UPI001C6F565D|nr:iron ABC transporter permease [Streptomyces sp. MBT84]MBW8707320.1 putative siderophore transport system permease protein YfiZ [Streptomyces sp. MBT84]